MTPEVQGVFGGLFVVLALASGAGWYLNRKKPSRALDNWNARVRAWWVMIAAGGAALSLGRPGVLLLFALVSAWALVEFSGWGWWLLAVPAQYLAIGFGPPWVAFALIPSVYLLLRERWGILLCVSGLSFIPLLARLEWMLYLVLVVQSSDVLQYIWGRWLGRRPVAPALSPAKTVEGLAGGVVSATLLGSWLYFLSPFPAPVAALVSLVITLAGFWSGLLFSAMKRQRGVKDWGTAISGHGGMLDRVDSLCLSAPLFYLLANSPLAMIR